MTKRILDAHVHLWPSSAANSAGHSWMKPEGPLTRQFSLADYLDSCDSQSPFGFIYVETDRALGTAPQHDQPVSDHDMRAYAEQPLEEIRFLRRIVEGQGSLEGSIPSCGGMLKAIVLWAPLQLLPDTFEKYLEEAEITAGELTWSRVKGFRFLLQSYSNVDALQGLILSDNWLRNLRSLGERGYSFDITVDSKRGGVWQLETAAEMAAQLRSMERGSTTKLILDHLGKPDIAGHTESPQQKQDFERWSRALELIATLPKTYIKLSGAFSEMDPPEKWSSELIRKEIAPWLEVVFRTFGPRRVMFGSDWPICNVQGPGKESWSTWYTVIEEITDSYKLTEEEKAEIWNGTAARAYSINM